MTICAGTAADITWDRGNWIFLDMGFSSKSRSCGVLISDETPQCLRFSDVISAISNYIARFDELNLVVGAPLSVCFDRSGNPAARSIEVEGGQSRRWYVGPGCMVMVASMYFLRELKASTERCSVRLFEGFVSYKKSNRTGHGADVEALRRVVRDPVRFQSAIYEGERLKRNRSDQLLSAFRVLGMDWGVPAVIKTGQAL